MKLTRLLILLAFISPLSLVSEKYPIINYQTSDGLPQNQINALIQGNQGYILVGTQSGIGKFDGNQFTAITRKHGLPHNFITDFALDASHNLWIATQAGLAKINQQSDTIDNYLTSKLIKAVAADKTSGRLWVLTEKKIYYRENETFSAYNKLPDTIVNTRDLKGLAVTGTGLIYFYSDSLIIEIKDRTAATVKSSQKINFLKSAGGKIFVGTENGFFLLENRQLIPYIDLPPRMNNVTDVAVDETQNLWLGTHGGVLYYNRKQNDTITITKENGLTHDRVTKILIDKEKNVFIGTQLGLFQLSLQLFKMYDTSDGLSNEFVWCITEDTHNNSILIGSDSGISELKAGKIYPLAGNKQLQKASVRGIIQMGENDFLIGTRNNGIFRWNRRDTAKPIHETAHVLSAIKSSTGKSAWFGTENGLLKYDGKRFKTFRDGLRNKKVWCLAVYGKDTLLLGTGKGIQKFHKGKFVHNRLEKIVGDELINDINVVSKSEILVATELKGLYIYRNNRLTHLTTFNGLLHNDVWSVIKDNSGNIWFNTSVSLDRYNGGFISHFNKKTGLFGDEGSLHATLKDSKGKIYFGIAPGLVEISPQVKSARIPPPSLFIKNVTVNSSAQPLKGSHELKHNQNNIEFVYIAVSTRKENPVFYRTRLSPFDQKWSHAVRDTQIKYLNLPPGDYSFEVEANNTGGQQQWIKSKNKITFSIAKPFWLSWWFISSVIVLLFGFIVFIVKIRLKGLERQKKFLETEVKKRTREIFEKNRELARLSVTDPLTDLKNRRYLEEKIKEDISLIERHIFDQSRVPEESSQGAVTVLGVFILDIDRFKKVNDEYGHKAGDIVIVEIARLLLEMLRNSDTIVRWGGEEFLIITRQTAGDNSFELSERIRKRIKAYPFKIDETITINKTISIGFAHFPFIPGDIETINWSQVLSLADSALYIAKKNGRNLTVGINAGVKPLDIDTKEIVSDIQFGLDKKYIELVSVKKNLKIPQLKM